MTQHTPTPNTLTLTIDLPLSGQISPVQQRRQVEEALTAAGLNAAVSVFSREAQEALVQRHLEETARQADLKALRGLYDHLDLPDGTLHAALLTKVPWPGAERRVPTDLDAQLALLLTGGKAAATAELDRLFQTLGADLPKVEAELRSEDGQISVTVNATPWLSRFEPLGLDHLLRDRGGASSGSTDHLMDLYARIDPEVQAIYDHGTAMQEGGVEEGSGSDAVLNPGHLLLFIRAQADRNGDFQALAARLSALDPETVDHRDLELAAGPDRLS